MYSPMNKFAQMLSTRGMPPADPRMQRPQGPPQVPSQQPPDGGRSPLGYAMRPQTPMPGDPAASGGMGAGILQRARQELMQRELRRRQNMMGGQAAMSNPPMATPPMANPPHPEMY
jgi:hypothetical protein